MKREDVYWALLLGLLSCQTYFQYHEYLFWLSEDLPKDTQDIQFKVETVDLDCFPRNSKWENDAISAHFPPQSFQCGGFQFVIRSHNGIHWSEARSLKEYGCDIDIDRIACSEPVKVRGSQLYRTFTATFEKTDQPEE